MLSPSDEKRGKRLCWATDIHLDFLAPEQVEAFYDSLIEAQPDAVLLGGDIARADNLEAYLRHLDKRISFPVYFVLGNHDYYCSSIAETRNKLRHLVQTSQHLVWLPHAGVVSLTEKTGLIGMGGWGDGRLGDYENSSVKLNDSVYIEELKDLDKHALHQKMLQLGAETATHFKAVLPHALAHFQHILILMHVPPFAEACLYEGRPGDANTIPFFTCGAPRELLYRVARENPFHHFTVLCGHTHHPYDKHLLPNLQVKVGGAAYAAPAFQEPINVY